LNRSPHINAVVIKPSRTSSKLLPAAFEELVLVRQEKNESQEDYVMKCGFAAARRLFWVGLVIFAPTLPGCSCGTAPLVQPRRSVEDTPPAKQPKKTSATVTSPVHLAC
jgi:hypothetical protein